MVSPSLLKYRVFNEENMKDENKRKIKKISDSFLAIFFPSRCPYCDRVIRQNEAACSDCEKKLSRVRIIRHAVGGCACYCAFPYRGRYAEAVKNLKFNRRFAYCKPLAMAICRVLAAEEQTDFDYVTCVPMHKSGKNARGFNQAELLARECAAILELPYLEALEKVKKNEPQHEIKKIESKRKNVKNVYAAKDGEAIKNEKILIIDDIITTGNTLGECCRVLQRYTPYVICAAVCSTEGKPGGGTATQETA